MKALRGLGLKLFLTAMLLGGGALAIWWDDMTQTDREPLPVKHLEEKSAAAKPAPDVVFSTLNGHRVNSWKDFTEPQVIVHFWASWCPPCLVEMPKIMAYAQAHKGDVAVVMVSTDDEAAPMRKAMRPYAAAPVSWVWDVDKRLSLKTFQVLNVPETFVLDAQRRMVDKRVGPQIW